MEPQHDNYVLQETSLPNPLTQFAVKGEKFMLIDLNGESDDQVFGDMNYWYNMQPYYDIENINTYPSAGHLGRL